MSQNFGQQLRKVISMPKDRLKSLWGFFLAEIREILYWKWVLDGHIGQNLSVSTNQKLTVIVPSYHASRARNIQPLIRSVLKCDFVEKIIISNHNPLIRLEDWVEVSDDARVMLINQPVRRGCGYGWIVASQQSSDYFVVIDDDLLIYPDQLVMLFQRLIEEPESPHGFIGRRSDGEYVMQQETEVAFLYNIYAVTKTHIQRYLEYAAAIVAKGYASQESIEYWSDDIIISQTGVHQPRIHDAGFILQCKTTRTSGVATFVEGQFEGRRLEVYQALQKVKKDTSSQQTAPQHNLACGF
ncbi:MAG: glycosyltransferase family A protein [Microcoleaceae cyanobacterium]